MNKKIIDCETEYFLSLEEEDKATLKFVNDNPFYTFEEWSSILQHYKNKILMMPELVCIIGCPWDEVSFTDYQEVKKLYDNCIDKKKIIQIGKKANKSGGFERMQKLYYLYKLLSPFHLSKIMVIRSSPNIVEHYWNGIGNWKH